jgi:hypothetical protein
MRSIMRLSASRQSRSTSASARRSPPSARTAKMFSEASPQRSRRHSRPA